MQLTVRSLIPHISLIIHNVTQDFVVALCECQTNPYFLIKSMLNIHRASSHTADSICQNILTTFTENAMPYF